MRWSSDKSLGFSALVQVFQHKARGPHILTSLFYAVVSVALFQLQNVTHHSFHDFSNLRNWGYFSLLTLIARIALLSLGGDVTYHVWARREKYSEILNSVIITYLCFVIKSIYLFLRICPLAIKILICLLVKRRALRRNIQNYWFAPRTISVFGTLVWSLH